jgi:cyclopropane-fatty-acyl-phospholipid synthase
MVEAVGHRYMGKYFSKLTSCLKRDGLLGIQAITAPDANYNDMQNGLGWLQKYIFPGGQLPSITYMLDSANKAGGFQLHKYRDIGQHYISTLKYWRNNFESNIDAVKTLGFDETFCRMWRYYLAYCIAAFESRNASNVQMVMTRPNNLELDDSLLELA